MGVIMKTNKSIVKFLMFACMLALGSFDLIFSMKPSKPAKDPNVGAAAPAAPPATPAT